MRHVRHGILAFIATAALALGVSATARADEEEVKESDVPKAVIGTLKKKYPTASLREFSRDSEAGKVTYEVEVEDGKRRIDVELSPEGKILIEEEKVSLDAVPERVKKALAASKYAKATAKKVEKVTTEEKADTESYEFHLVDGEKRFEVVFDRDGKIVKEEEKKAKDEEEDEEDERD